MKLKTIIGTAVGAARGCWRCRLAGCPVGGCPLTRNPWITTACGFLPGFLATAHFR